MRKNPSLFKLNSSFLINDRIKNSRFYAPSHLSLVIPFTMALHFLSSAVASECSSNDGYSRSCSDSSISSGEEMYNSLLFPQESEEKAEKKQPALRRDFSPSTRYKQPRIIINNSLNNFPPSAHTSIPIPQQSHEKSWERSEYSPDLERSFSKRAGLSSNNSTAHPFSDQESSLSSPTSSEEDLYTRNMLAIQDKLVEEQESDHKNRLAQVNGGGFCDYITKKTPYMAPHIHVAIQDALQEPEKIMNKFFEETQSHINTIFFTENKQQRNETDIQTLYLKSWLFNKEKINDRIRGHLLTVSNMLEYVREKKLGMEFLTESTFAFYSKLLRPINLHEDLFQYIYNKTNYIKKYRHLKRTEDRTKIQIKFSNVQYDKKIQKICNRTECPPSTLSLPNTRDEFIHVSVSRNVHSLDSIHIWDIKNKIFFTFIHSFYTEMSNHLEVRFLNKKIQETLLDYYEYNGKYFIDAYAFRNPFNQYYKTTTGIMPDTRLHFSSFKNQFETTFWNHLDAFGREKVKKLNEKVEHNFTIADMLVEKEGLTGAVKRNLTIIASKVPDSPLLNNGYAIGASIASSASNFLGYMSGTSPTSTTPGTSPTVYSQSPQYNGWASLFS